MTMTIIKGHQTSVDNFITLGRQSHNLTSTIKEAIYIRVNDPSLRKTLASTSCCAYGIGLVHPPDLKTGSLSKSTLGSLHHLSTPQGGQGVQGYIMFCAQVGRGQVFINQSNRNHILHQTAQYLSHSQLVPCISSPYMASSSVMLSAWHPIYCTSHNTGAI